MRPLSNPTRNFLPAVRSVRWLLVFAGTALLSGWAGWAIATAASSGNAPVGRWKAGSEQDPRVPSTSGGSHPSPGEQDPLPGLEMERIESRYLPNCWRIHGQLISGGLPEGPAAFRQLKDLGVRTVISVDGARPDLESARAAGLRYLHLPVEYSGIDPVRQKELAKALRELPGPFYIHCHHGLHRSPAATAVAAVGAGWIDAADAESILQLAGTSPDYRGLYLAVRKATRLEETELAAVDCSFPEQANTPATVDTMVKLDAAFQVLEEIAREGWNPPVGHPDIDPAHTTLLVRELFAESVRLVEPAEYGRQFVELMELSRDQTAQLETVLRSHPGRDGASPEVAKWRAAADSHLNVIRQACRDCHRQFRDRPDEEAPSEGSLRRQIPKPDR